MTTNPPFDNPTAPQPANRPGTSESTRRAGHETFSRPPTVQAQAFPAWSQSESLIQHIRLLEKQLEEVVSRNQSLERTIAVLKTSAATAQNLPQRSAKPDASDAELAVTEGIGELRRLLGPIAPERVQQVERTLAFWIQERLGNIIDGMRTVLDEQFAVELTKVDALIAADVRQRPASVPASRAKKF